MGLREAAQRKCECNHVRRDHDRVQFIDTSGGDYVSGVLACAWCDCPGFRLAPVQPELPFESPGQAACGDPATGVS